MWQKLLSALIVFCILSANVALANAVESEFTGTQSCISCHSEQHQLWENSHHDMAMQHANKDTVLADFNNTEFTANGFTTRFFTRQGKYFTSTDASDGSMQDFEIK